MEQSPALAGGRIYVAAGNGQIPRATVVSALDAVTGAIIWQEEIPLAVPVLSGVTYSGEALYFGTDDYVVRSLDARTGAERWATPITGLPSDPVVAHGRVWVAANSTGVYCLDAATGEIVWKSHPISGSSSA